MAQARVELLPSMSMFAVYDDNLFAHVNGSAGRMQQLRPSVEGSYLSPTVTLLGLYSFDMQRSNFATLNTLDARRHALGDTRVRVSPFTTVGLTFRYDRSATPGEIDIESGVLGDRRLAQRVELTPSFVRRLDPRTAMTVGYGWTAENLVDGERGTLHIGRAGLTRTITARTTLSASYVGRVFSDTVATDQSHTALLGWNVDLAPGTHVSVFAGPNISSYRGLRPELNAGVARSTPRVRLALDYSHGDTIILGVRGPVAVDSLTSRVTWPLTHRFDVGTSTGLSQVSTLDARTSTIYRGGLAGSWSPGGMYTVGATYGLDLQQGSIRNPVVRNGTLVPFDDRVVRQVVRISVTVAPRYSHSSLPPDEAARAKGVLR